ncbi:hypothetical protein Dimus_039118 [Dionaea muscipula]
MCGFDGCGALDGDGDGGKWRLRGGWVMVVVVRGSLISGRRAAAWRVAQCLSQNKGEMEMAGDGGPFRHCPASTAAVVGIGHLRQGVGGRRWAWPEMPFLTV